MTILKLSNEGECHTALVTACSEVAGKFGPQVMFTFDNGDVLYISAQTAARQLLRCGFDDGSEEPRPDYEAVCGNTLTFSRDHNPNGKPYWGITVADGIEKAAAKRPSKRAAMGLPANAAAAQREVPPPKDEDFHDMMRDTPPAEDYPTKQPPVAPTVRRMDEYFDLARKVAAFQAEVSKASKDGIPYDFSSVNAMTFSIWNTR